MPTKETISVVIAEDESLVADIIQHQLEFIGMKVVGRATNGRQAVELTRTLRPSVILMDITMPEMDGIAATEAIAKECPTPVVILSAHETAEDVARATAAGVGAYLVKPPQGPELERAIIVAIARHADLLELRRMNHDLDQALKDVKTLKGLLPICSGCKEIRDDKGYWSRLEVYFMQHTEVRFTHSLCPTCCKKYFPDSKNIDEI